MASAGRNEPAVQASYMKNLVAALGERGHAEALRERAPELFRAVDDAPRMSWLPVELNLRMVDLLAEHFGEDRGLEVLRDCLHAQFETPLWRNFVRGAIRLLGRSPAALGRWIPRAYDLVFRGCGTWSAELVEPGRLRVVATGMPPALLRQELWLRSLTHSMGVLFRLCEVDGSTKRLDCDPLPGRVRFELRWKA